MPDYYAVLGVSPKASSIEIKRAYHNLAAQYHPDKHRGNDLADLAGEKLIQINEAYEVLSDENRRADYDRERLVRPAGRSWASGPSTTGSVPEAGKALFRLVVVIMVVFFALRFIRSPRALAVLGVVILLAWFLPRLLKRMKK